MKKGEIYYANLGQNYDSEQSGIRLVCVVQNNIGNIYSSTTIICPLTSQIKPELPTHVTLYEGVPKVSTILAEQIRVVSKRRLFKEKIIYTLTDEELEKLNQAIKISLGV